jgi:hypothetical protein
MSSDGARLEWVVLADIPESGESRYEVEFALEVPATLAGPEDVWARTQIFTRLRSPSEEGAPELAVQDVDGLRRDALGIAHRLKLLRDDFARGLDSRADPTLLDDVIERAGEIVSYARASVPRGAARERLPGDVRHELELADEFLSVRLLDFCAGIEKLCDRDLLPADSPARVANTALLRRELEVRRERGWMIPTADGRAELSRYLARAGRLKAHFQNVLYLDAEAEMTDSRLRNWTAVVAACLAAAFWLGFTLLPIGPDAKVKIGIGTFSVLFAISYALKDRIKELVRLWLLGELVRRYGQRAVTLRVPERLDPRRPVLVETRETFNARFVAVPDALHEGLGRTQRALSLVFKMATRVHAAPGVAKHGMHRLKHVFRYDLSGICARLGDMHRAVPVLDGDDISLVAVQKEAWVPVRLTVRGADGEQRELRRDLVLTRSGVARIE